MTSSAKSELIKEYVKQINEHKMHKKIIFTCSWNNINSTYPVMYEDFLRISKEREDVIVLNVTKVDLSFVKTLFTKKIKLLTIDHSIVSLFRFDYNKISNV